MKVQIYPWAKFKLSRFNPEPTVKLSRYVYRYNILLLLSFVNTVCAYLFYFYFTRVSRLWSFLFDFLNCKYFKCQFYISVRIFVNQLFYNKQ